MTYKRKSRAKPAPVPDPVVAPEPAAPVGPVRRLTADPQRATRFRNLNDDKLYPRDSMVAQRCLQL